MSDTLLISLGTSQAIVPEAFLLPGAKFSAVHVLTTETTPIDSVRSWFRGRAPEVDLSITRVAGFQDFLSEAEHQEFEEVLHRWYLFHRSTPLPHVCIAGGFKTMSSAMQKAAAIFGAAEVFHVLCHLPAAQLPNKPDEIDAALANEQIKFIRLGAESGWPQLLDIGPVDYPLQIVNSEECVTSVSAPDFSFRERLRDITERGHRIAGAWENLHTFPFIGLATWSAADLAWLSEPVDPPLDRPWVAALPKIELHCHLGGFATSGDLLKEVRAAAVSPKDLPPLLLPVEPAFWPRPHVPLALDSYMRLGDANGTKLLKDPGCLRRQCELLYARLIEDRVLHAEIRCSPANYASEGRSPWKVLSEIKEAFDCCMRSEEATNPGSSCHVNLLIIATRLKAGNERAAIARHLALAVTAAEHWTRPQECRVVGVDLAGYEEKATRAQYYREDFTGIHRCGLALTVHAGENDDAEGIWRAVFDLNARRIGHALHLADSPELMRSVADRGIGVEMCPFANYQIKGFAPMPTPDNSGTLPPYPLLGYLRRGIRVCVNTDNIGISAASLTDNLLFAATLCPGLTRMDVLQLLANSLDLTFLPPTQRDALRKKMEQSLNTRSAS